MKGKLFVFLLLLAPAGARAADDGGPAWKDGAYAAEFCLIEEAGRYDAESWEALPAEAKSRALENAAAGDKAARRGEEVRAYYAEMTARWSLEDVSQKLDRLSAGGIRAVRIWLGEEHAGYLERKRGALAPLRAAGPGAPLSGEAVRGAAPFLQAGAAAELKAALRAGSVPPELAAKTQKRQAELSGKVDGARSVYGASVGAGNGEKFFDGANQYGGKEAPDSPRISGGGLNAGKISGNYRQSHASTVPGGAVPGLGGAAPAPAPAARQPQGFSRDDLKRIDTVVGDMKVKRQAAGSENGWLGNFKQSVGLSKADSGCSGWSEATMNAIKNDPVLGQKYEVGYVRGLRNPVGAVTKWPPSVPLPLPHFVAVVWPKGTDPNTTAIYVDSWAKDTKRGPIKDYTYEYSFDPKDLTPTVYYNKEVKREIKLPGGRTKVVTETVETSIPLIKSNPWIFVGK